MDFNAKLSAAEQAIGNAQADGGFTALPWDLQDKMNQAYKLVAEVQAAVIG